MGERVLTVLGNKASRPIEDFMVNVSKEFYVGPNGKTSDVGDDDRSGRSKKTSLATWAKAVTKATASRGDIIYLLPGHTETFATAAAVNLSKIGVRTINLGQGALAATFTFSAVNATITMTAASCSIEGFPIFKPSIDSVVSPLVISAADCKADIQIQDASALMECVNGVLTTAAADRLDLDVKYRGFIAGDACINAVRLVGVDTARINVDFYGVASTSIVEFHTTACHDIDISGKFYNDGTSLTKNVVDSVGGTPSTWSCQGWDGNSNANFSGGDNAALATDDVTALATAIGLIDEFHDVPAANNTLNAQVNEVIGNKTDTTAVGAVTATDTLVAYIKQLVAGGIARDTALGLVDGYHGVPVADAATNAFMRDVVGIKTDAAINAVTTTKTLMAYLKGVLNEITVPAQNNTDNDFINDVIGQKTDAAAAGAVTTDDTLVGYIKQIITELGTDGAGLLDLGGMSTAMLAEVEAECTDAIEADDLDHLLMLDDAGQNYPVNCANDSVIAKMIAKGATATPSTYDNVTDSQEMISDKLGGFSGDGGAVSDDSVKASLDLLQTHADATPQCVEKSDGAVLNGLDPLFTITGGPVRAKIVGHVTTMIGGASNLRLQHITTDPAATVELNAGAVAVNTDAVGTIYHNLGATSVFTPSGGLGFVLLDPVTVEETEFILAPGVVQCLGSAAQTGVIKWYMSYVPLSPSSAVVAAA